MKPKFIHPERFHATVTDRTVRSFLFRRTVYSVTIEDGFALQDRSGAQWRPVQKQFDSDAASIPHPLDWLIPAFDPLRYKRGTMGIHDPACTYGWLERLDVKTGMWTPTLVSRAKADSLLQQAIQAEGGWRLTRGVYWLGIRAGAGAKRVKEWVCDR